MLIAITIVDVDKKTDYYLGLLWNENSLDDLRILLICEYILSVDMAVIEPIHYNDEPNCQWNTFKFVHKVLYDITALKEFNLLEISNITAFKGLKCAWKKVPKHYVYDLRFGHELLSYGAPMFIKSEVQVLYIYI